MDGNLWRRMICAVLRAERRMWRITYYAAVPYLHRNPHKDMGHLRNGDCLFEVCAAVSRGW